jgi:hypothetical protein
MQTAVRVPAWQYLEVDGERLVRPNYVGAGLANVAPTVLRLLAPASEAALPGLSEGYLPGRLTRDLRAIVVLVADGLGHVQLEREIAAGNAPVLGGLIARATLGERVSYAAITSVFPTTTVAALGALNSAALPIEHGLLGYTLFLQEYGLMADMIRWGPLERRGSFADQEFGYSPEGFFWAETLYQRLHAAGVEQTFAINPSAFAGTALTRMLHQGATYRGYLATSSLTPIATRLLGTADGPVYVYAYWPTVDMISHVHGPESDEHAAEVANFDAAVGRLVDRLPSRDDTLLIVTADHGHVQTAPDRQVPLGAHPRLLSLLAAPPAGERRAVYLHPQPGGAAAVAAYAREHLREVAAVLTRDEAVDEGLFGAPTLPARAAARIGEVLLLPRDNLQIVSGGGAQDGTPGERPPLFHGLHGGLSEPEALVPLLALRL